MHAHQFMKSFKNTSIIIYLQIEGKLPIVGRDDDKVKVNVSKHGIKVIDVKGQVSG